MLPYIHIWKLDIPGYGLCMALGIITATLLSYARIKRRGGDLDSLLIVGSVTMLCALTSAVFAYILFSYGLKRFLLEIISGNYSALENTGMVFYGGLIGGILGAHIAIRLNKYDFHTFCDAIVPTIPLAHAFGRIGCTLAGCCYGKQYDGPFAVHSAFVGENVSLFPIQAVEALINCLLFFVLMFYVKKHREQKHNTLAVYLLLYSIERFVLEFFRGDTIRGTFGIFSSSQWISIAIVAVLLIYGISVIYSDQKRKV